LVPTILHSFFKTNQEIRRDVKFESEVFFRGINRIHTILHLQWPKKY